MNERMEAMIEEGRRRAAEARAEAVARHGAEAVAEVDWMVSVVGEVLARTTMSDPVKGRQDLHFPWAAVRAEHGR